jgi:hypothetical protein
MFFLLASSRVTAQENTKSADTSKKIILPKEQLNAVEGIFQNSGNPEMYVQIIAAEDGIIGKLLWNNNQVKLTPESPLVFQSKDAGGEGPLRVVFTKDASGIVTQLTVGNNIVWNRVKAYKPATKTEMAHTPAQLKPFEGIYQLQNDDPHFIQFYEKGNKLILKQFWDNNEVALIPDTELSFFGKDIPLFSLEFTKEKDGNITKVKVAKRDTWNKIALANPSAAELKIFEGKYQSKDDPDNILQVFTRDHQLVVKQGWDGKEINLTAITNLYFYNEAQSYPLAFKKGTSDRDITLTIFDVDQFSKIN